MNENTLLYKSIRSLLDDANSILDPISNSNYKNFNEMQLRLIDVMNKTISLISQMKDVNALDDDKVANTLFSSLKNKNPDIGALKQLALSLLYSLRLLCKKVTPSIKPEYSSRYQNFSLELIIDLTDFFDLYCYTNWDKNIRKKYKPFPVKVGRRSSLDLKDQREVIRSLIWMETVPCIEKLSFRDIRPHVQILIRQSLEMLFKQIIGYEDIVDSKGDRIKKFTQIGVKFLSKYRDKQDNSGCTISGKDWNITLTMPIKTLEGLNTWCNNFTHNPFIVSLSVIYFVYEQYERFTDKCISKPNYTIVGEENMRKEFADFVSRQNPDATVQWS